VDEGSLGLFLVFFELFDRQWLRRHVDAFEVRHIVADVVVLQ